jgi:hypothetical protein
MIDMFKLTSYANRVGVYLKNFKQKKARLWEFSHSCEVQHGFKSLKKRGYIYQTTDGKSLNVKCQHCGYSKSLPNFIREISPSLYDEFRLEAYRDTDPVREIVKEEQIPIPDVNLDGLIPVISLPPSSPVLKFLERRCIPKEHYDKLYVAKQFYDWATQYKPEFKDSKDKSPRLVIPYFHDNRVIGFTCRTFNPSVEPRYIHLRIDKRVEFIYGTDRINTNKKIYVVEGNIDSLFLDNAIAIGGAHYHLGYLQQHKNNCVIIPDSDWRRNKQVGEQLRKAIEAGYHVAFMPARLRGKDINDWVKNGLTKYQLQQIIQENTKRGLTAKLEFSILKKY